MAARALLTEKQDGIDTTLVRMNLTQRRHVLALRNYTFFLSNTSLIYPDREDQCSRSLVVAYREDLEGRKESAKETGRCLGMGTNIYSSFALLGKNKDEATIALAVDGLTGKTDGWCFSQ